MRWVERQIDCRVKKIVLDRAKEYIKGTKELKANGTNICVTAGYISEENGRA